MVECEGIKWEEKEGEEKVDKKGWREGKGSERRGLAPDLKSYRRQRSQSWPCQATSEITCFRCDKLPDVFNTFCVIVC